MPSPFRLLATLAVAFARCGTHAPPPTTAHHPAPVTMPPPSSSTPPAPAEIPARFTVVSCGYGGVGPSAPPPAPAPVWVVALVDVASDAPVDALAVASIELLATRDAGPATPVARDGAELSVRVAPPGRSAFDYAEYGTTPMPPSIPPGARVRLRVHARLDRSLVEVVRAAPTRVRVRFTARDAAPAAIDGDVQGPWPTG